jgi:ABC-2 type transport system permease protein
MRRARTENTKKQARRETMNWQNVATIAAKDIRIMLARRGFRIALPLFPLVLAIGFSQIIAFGHIPVGQLPRTLNAFLFFFIMYTGAMPAAIASYSLVGEKIERSLEPLIATPASDSEILLGKGVAALVPPLAALWTGMLVLMVYCDVLTHATLGGLYFPNWTAAVTVFGVAPLIAIMGVGFSVLWSARVSEVRTAQQLGALIALPMAGVYVAILTGALTVDPPSLGILCGILAVVDAALAVADRAAFGREEILTRWA